MMWHWSGEVVRTEVSVIIESLRHGWQRLVVVRCGFFILNLGWNRFGTPERFDRAWARLRCELVNLGFL